MHAQFFSFVVSQTNNSSRKTDNSLFSCNRVSANEGSFATGLSKGVIFQLFIGRKKYWLVDFDRLEEKIRKEIWDFRQGGGGFKLGCFCDKIDISLTK